MAPRAPKARTEDIAETDRIEGFAHPRETQHLVGQDLALARAARCDEHFLGDRREMVAHLLRQFESALDSQESRDIEQGRVSLLKALDELEGESYL